MEDLMMFMRSILLPSRGQEYKPTDKNLKLERIMELKFIMVPSEYSLKVACLCLEGMMAILGSMICIV